MNLIGQIALTFGVLSLLSIGGANATIPEIHRQVVDLHHWMDDATFASLVAIGQTAPGPNVLIVGAIGWQIAGFLGLMAASIAIILPSSVVALGLSRVMRRFAAVEGLEIARRALAPIALGFMLASGWVMTRAAYASTLSLLIVAAAAGLLVTTRLSPIWAIAGGAVVGLLAGRLHGLEL